MADRFNDERDSFEVWAKGEGWPAEDFKRDRANGCYLDETVRVMWLGWAARATRGVKGPDHG